MCIESLKQNQDIIIRKADKGGSLFIQNKEDHIAEAKRLLGDTDTYMKLRRDPTVEYTKESKILLDRALVDAVLTKNEYHFVYNRHAITPHFYHIPKVHKNEVDPQEDKLSLASTISPAIWDATSTISCRRWRLASHHL